MTPSKEVEALIAKAFDLFGSYEVRLPLEVCTDCCMDPKHAESLATMHVRHIPFELLYEYNTAARAEDSSQDEYKHFLPRILEFLANGRWLHHDVAIILSGFRTGAEVEITDEEKEFFVEFAQAFFLQCLNQYPLPDHEEIVGILALFVDVLGVDLKLFLDIWKNTNTTSSLCHLADLANGGFKSRKPNKLKDAFASEALGNGLSNWLQQKEGWEAKQNAIEHFIMNPGDADEWTIQEVSWLYEKLNN